MRKIGAFYNAGECEFIIWSPYVKSISVYLCRGDIVVPMERDSEDYWRIKVDDFQEGDQYYLILNGKKRGDPASFFQPQGVTGPSQLVDHSSFRWDDDDFEPVKLRDYIIYELHTGTFTPEGTFQSIVNRLDYLVDLGVTAVELMPVAQFPGKRNWGYDGVFHFAPQNSYGGPAGLKSLVNEAHKKGLSVILDVVYNHLGPEGNYLHEFGPFLNDQYKSPWGSSINYDQEYSDHVRNYFIYNAIFWLSLYHIDGLRLDAVHAVRDFSANSFLAELSAEVDMFSEISGKQHYVIAESDLNDVRVISQRKNHGFGCHAQWNDDFHHSIHAVLTNEIGGYYQDFGKTDHIAKAITNNFVYSGNYSLYRKRHHGNSPLGFTFDKFVNFIQNHDQTGNRAFGERLSVLVPFEGLKLAAAVLILSPSIPMLFMGEEYGEDNPFLYFVDFLDDNLNSTVRNGRYAEFAKFNWQENISDPAAEEAFLQSKPDVTKIESGKYRCLLKFYKFLISMRKMIPALKNYDRPGTRAESYEQSKILTMERTGNKSRVFAVMNFNSTEEMIGFRFPEGKWIKLLDSSEEKWYGPGSTMPEKYESKSGTFILPGYNFSLYQFSDEIKIDEEVLNELIEEVEAEQEVI